MYPQAAGQSVGSGSLGSYSPNRANSDPPADSPGVFQLLDMIDKSIVGLGSELSELRDRLQPISNPTPPVGGNVAQADSPASVVGRQHRILNQLEMAMHFVRGLRNNLQL